MLNPNRKRRRGGGGGQTDRQTDRQIDRQRQTDTERGGVERRERKRQRQREMTGFNAQEEEEKEEEEEASTLSIFVACVSGIFGTLQEAPENKHLQSCYNDVLLTKALTPQG